MAEKIFTYEYDGFKFQIILTEENGVVSAQIKVLEGWADFNAFYWGDNDHSGDSAKLDDKNLNMNGEGSQYTDEDGDTTNVQWDGAQKLSDVGLGKNKTSNIVSEGETSEAFILEGVTCLDDIDFFGVRATSVNGEGSIKGVAQEDPDDEDDNHFPDFANDISHVDFYFDLDGDVDNGAEFIVRVNTTAAVDDDLDTWYTDAVDYIKNQYAHLADAELLGAAIWGGNLFPEDDPKGKKYYYALDGDPNPDDPIAPGIVANNIVDDDPDYGVQGGFGFGGTGIDNIVLHYDGNVFQDTPFV